MKGIRRKQSLDNGNTQAEGTQSSTLKLTDGSRVGVIGGGPAGSLFSYFLLEMAHRVGMEIQVDIYELKDFSSLGPLGCNMCGGIISELLVQRLAIEGINLPSSVVQRGIDSYVMHMDVGSVHIETPLQEKRIAAIHRGAGPTGMKEIKWDSFDGYFQKLTIDKGVNLIQDRVNNIDWVDGKPQVNTQAGEPQVYDLIGVAAGVNSTTLKLFDGLGLDYEPPQVTKTYISDFYLGQDIVQEYFGNSMHVFMLDIPQLKFAALIPKGDFVTLCILGHEIDNKLVQSFINRPEVLKCFPPDWHVPEKFCHCSPRLNMNGAVTPFADRMIFIGDCGVSRLYKDGIGAAYRTAKAAAATAIFKGISAQDFRQHYLPTCKAITTDNNIGKIIFAFVPLINKIKYARYGILRMASREQQKEGKHRHMSMVLWDMFTGSSHYRDIFLRSIHPLFLMSLIWNVIVGIPVKTRH